MFEGRCEYVITEDHCKGRKGSFRIQASNVACMAGGATCSKVIVVNILDTILHLRKGHAITSEPVTKGKPMMAKYEIIKTTFFDIIHADEIGITVMWDRGTRLRVHIKPSFKGKRHSSFFSDGPHYEG